VVDDAEQGITEIIRGADLLDSSPQQIYLQQILGLQTPDYGHLPVVMHNNGIKLSKSHQDLPLNHHRPVEILTQALKLLKQAPPDNLAQSSLEDFWQWAVQHWDLKKVPRNKEICFDLFAGTSKK
ncbi:MAG: tRNA glutamyl-Q(34) synthetase GluQRS, partial [Gammaproteobacteria bacterium]|nr:tRNA glutamyl-Q(34) synthetase GluQRS [Gammaproteobacteria bacterium]